MGYNINWANTATIPSKKRKTNGKQQGVLGIPCIENIFELVYQHFFHLIYQTKGLIASLKLVQ